MVLLTTEGLFVKRIIREQYQDLYLSDYIKIDIDQPILSFYLDNMGADLYITTSTYVLKYSLLYNRKTIINIDGCLGFFNHSELYYWTKNGLYKNDTWNNKVVKINIEGDILDIASASYKVYILTTKGLYKSNRDLISFELIDILNVKHISGDYILTTNGDLWTNNVIIGKDIIYMSAYESSVVALKEDGYYAIGDHYYLDTFKKLIDNKYF